MFDLCAGRQEELVNEETYFKIMKARYANIATSIMRKFPSLEKEKFQELKIFAQSHANTYEHKHIILNAVTTTDMFNILIAGNYITEEDIKLLQDITDIYGGENLHEEKIKLREYKEQCGFAEFVLKVAHCLSEQLTMTELKITIFSTPVDFGSYYSKLENETEVRVAIAILGDWENPRLLQRIIRHHCPVHSDRIESYRQLLAPHSEPPPNSPERTLLIHLETFSDLIHVVATDLNRHKMLYLDPSLIFLSEAYPQLELTSLTEWTLCDVLKTLIPFCTHQNLHLLRYIVEKYSPDMKVKLESFAAQWNDFASKTRVTSVYNIQLNKRPMNLSARGIATLTLHLRGQHWQDPMLSQAAMLAQVVANTLHLEAWSVVACSIILTGSESDAKGCCKVELLMPTLAACKLIKEGGTMLPQITSLPQNASVPQSTSFLQNTSLLQNTCLKYIELKEEGKYYFCSEIERMEEMYRAALQDQHLSPQFEKLERMRVAQLPRPSLQNMPRTSNSLTHTPRTRRHSLAHILRGCRRTCAQTTRRRKYSLRQKETEARQHRKLLDLAHQGKRIHYSFTQWRDRKLLTSYICTPCSLYYILDTYK